MQTHLDLMMDSQKHYLKVKQMQMDLMRRMLMVTHLENVMVKPTETIQEL
jgi:hypothetical protein